MSEGKLDAFVLPQRRWGMPKRLDVDVEVFGAKLSVGTERVEDRRSGRFAHVLSYLQQAAKWYGDPVVQAGDWVALEGECAFEVYRGEVAIFYDGNPLSEPEPRFLLHGAPENLISWREGLDRSMFHNVSGWHGFCDRILEMQLAEEGDASNAEFNPLQSQLRRTADTYRWIRGHSTAALDYNAPTVSIASFAHVTAVVAEQAGEPGVVVASPLYIEHAERQRR